MRPGHKLRSDYPLISSNTTLDRFRLRLVQSRLNRPTNFDLQPEVQFERRIQQGTRTDADVHGEDAIDGGIAVSDDLRGALDVLRNLFKLLVYDYSEHWTSKMEVNWLLQQCLSMAPGSLVSFKLLVASASCGRPRPVLAHGVWRMEQHTRAEEIKFALFPSLIAMVLENVALYDALVGANNCNIYRTAFMMQCGSPMLNRKAFGYAGFTAVLQITMVVYVFIYTGQQIGEDEGGGEGSLVGWLSGDWVNGNVPLAALLFIFSMVIVYQGAVSGILLLHQNRFWTKVGESSGTFVCLLYRAIDVISNAIVPVALLFVGFFLICTSDTLMDAVLNSVALLFIPEIDDQMPALLGIPVDDVALKHVTSAIFPDLSSYVRHRKKALAGNEHAGAKAAPPAASTYLHDVLLAGAEIGEAIPRQVRRGHDEIAVDISPVGYLTAQCVFRRLDAVRRIRTSDTPDIVWLRLWPMDGGASVVFGSHTRFGSIVHLQKPVESEESDPTFWPQPEPARPRGEPNTQMFERLTLEGALVVTDIRASAVIERLRVCHAANGPQMLEGIEYYKLFECDSSAERLLSTEYAGGVTSRLADGVML